LTSEHPKQRTLEEHDKFLFLHIPKTAGTTLTSIIETHFDRRDIFPWNNQRDFSGLSRNEIVRYRYYRGHFFYRVVTEILDTLPVTITMMRNPIDRFLSDFAHLQRHLISTGTEAQREEISRIDVAEFVENASDRRSVRRMNLQTRMISGLEDLRKLRTLLPHLDLDPSQLSDPDVDRAKLQLAEFDFVGLAERFDESLMLLSYVFGWRCPVSYERINVAPERPRREDIPQRILQQLIERNALDLELYCFAERLFEDRLAEMKRLLLEQHGDPRPAHMRGPLSLEVLRALLERHYERRFATARQPIREAHFGLDRAIDGMGWQKVEDIGVHGPSRWTGPDRTASVDLPLERDQDLVVEFRILMALAPDVLDSLTLRVDNHPIALSRSDDPAGGYLFRGLVPRSALTSTRSFVRLEFSVNRMLAPRDVLSENQDKRQLGVLFNRLVVRPVV
jgi:hypothetical protein